MHFCNYYCSEDKHTDVTYTNKKEATIEECRRVLEKSSKIDVIDIKEIAEFSREVAIKQLILYGLNIDTLELTGYCPQNNEELRAFRFVFSYRKNE